MADSTVASAKLDREATRQTVLWGVGLNFATKLGSIALSIVLARMITPEEFGQYGTVSAVILLILSFSMQPFANHLFHQRDTQAEDFERHLAFGIVLHGVLFIVANLVALAMRFSPTLSVVSIYVHIGSLAILLNAPRIYYATVLRLQLKWKQMRLLGMVSLAAYAAASIAIARAGYGVLALLAQNLVVPLPFVIGFCFDRSVRRGINTNWRAYGTAFRFGLARTGSGFLGQGQITLENYALTLLAGFGPLGLFLRARGLAQLATTWLTEQVNTLLYPSMAQLEPRSKQALRVGGLLMRLGFWTTAPIVLIGCVAGEGVIRLLYGEKWLAAAPYLPWLLIAALAISQVGIARLIVLTGDGAKATLGLDAACAAANLVCLAVLPVWGLQVYAVCLAAVNVAFLVILSAWLMRGALIEPRDIYATFAPGLLVGGVAAALLALGGSASARWIGQPVGVVVAALSVGLAMIAVVRLLDPKGLHTICGLMPFGRHLRRGLALGVVPP